MPPARLASPKFASARVCRKNPDSRRDGNQSMSTKDQKMFEWFLFLMAAVLPIVIGRCIHEMSSDHD